MLKKLVKICQTGLPKLNFKTRPKKRIFRFLRKISAGHWWSWIFFANFQILGPLFCQGWVVIPQNVKKKSKSLHPTGEGLYHTSFGILRVEAGEVVSDVGWVNLRPALPCSFCLRRRCRPNTLLIIQNITVGWVNLKPSLPCLLLLRQSSDQHTLLIIQNVTVEWANLLPSLPCLLLLRRSCRPYTLFIKQNVIVGWVNIIPSLPQPLRRSPGPYTLLIIQNVTVGWVNLIPPLPCLLPLRSCGPHTLIIIQNVIVGWVNLLPSPPYLLQRSRNCGFYTPFW